MLSKQRSMILRQLELLILTRRRQRNQRLIVLFRQLRGLRQRLRPQLEIRLINIYQFLIIFLIFLQFLSQSIQSQSPKLSQIQCTFVQKTCFVHDQQQRQIIDSKNLTSIMFKFYLIVILCMFALSNAYMEVYIPECARKIIPDGVNYTLANFGYIPYGETAIGQLFLPKSNNSELCSIDGEDKFNADTKSFILVKRGICKFTQKVLNAQKLGAKFVIVYDNQTSDYPKVIMKNDGHGHLINIPSAFVSNNDGLKLIETLSKCNDQIYLKQVFDVFETEIVDLSLWLNLNNRQSYVLLKDFYRHDYFNVIQQYVNTSVKFRVDYECTVAFCDTNDCIGSEENKYCFPVDRSNIRDVVSGSELLKESLRMYLLFNMLPENKNTIWFEYMNKFDDNLCLEVKDVETCSYETMKQSGVSNDLVQAIQQNITNTFNQLNDAKFNQQNVFYWVAREADQKNIIFYPEAVINGKNFYGLFKAPQVFEMICNSLLAQPKQCYSFIKNKTAPEALDKTDDLWLTVFFIFLLMALGFLVALFVYTKLIKRQVNQQMSMEVNRMVENYVTLAQQKSGSSFGKKNLE